MKTSDNSSIALYRIEHNWRIKNGWSENTSDPIISVMQDQPPASQDDPLLDPETNEKWNAAKAEIKKLLKPVEFDTWVKNVKLREETKDEMVLSTGNEYAGKWFKDHVLPTAEKLTGSRVRITWGENK